MRNRNGQNGHPDLRTLEKYLHGELDDAGRRKLEGHLDVCPMCRVEVKTLRWFEEIDKDEELAQEASWDVAERILDNWAEEWVKGKAESEEPYTHIETAQRRISLSTLLSPLVAAAIIILIFIGIRDSFYSKYGSIMRSGMLEKNQIELVEPQGDISELPGAFVWNYSFDADEFELDVFTPELRTIVSVKRIKEGRYRIDNTLRASIEPGLIYIWRVSAYKDGEKISTSRTVWFRLVIGETE